MKKFNLNKSLFSNMGAVIFMASLITACGSYESVSYNDGIYGDSTKRAPIQTQEPAETYTDNSSAYYQSLFAQGAEQHGNNFSQDSTFTDVESYSSESYDESDPNYTASYGGGSPAWGSNPSEVNINYYNNGWGWNNWGWNSSIWNAGWGWNGFYVPAYANFGYGWNGFYGPGFNRFGWGWNNGFGWNAGWGWNNWGWNNWGWNNGYFGYNTYNRSRFAYLNSRGLDGRYATVDRYGRLRNERSAYNSRSTSRAANSRSNRSYRSGAYNRGNNRSYNRSSTSNRRSTSTRRSSTRTRSASPRGTNRSSGVRTNSSRSSRSSGTTRSSSSSRSSSGSRSSGGGRSGGRSGGRRG